jgi:hypothetical protein
VTTTSVSETSKLYCQSKRLVLDSITKEEAKGSATRDASWLS